MEQSPLGTPPQMPQNGAIPVPSAMPVPGNANPMAVSPLPPNTGQIPLPPPIPSSPAPLPEGVPQDTLIKYTDRVSPYENTGAPMNLPPSPSGCPPTQQYSQGVDANAQAQAIARAILQSQNLLGLQSTNAQQYPQYQQSNTSYYSSYVPDSTETEGVRETGIGHGERVIQPIHDMRREQQQSEIQKKMTELLGDTGPSEPTQINTRTAKKMGNTPVNMTMQNATQASGNVPNPAIPIPPAPNMPANAQNLPMPPQAGYQYPNDPRVAMSAQLQARQIEEMRRQQYAQTSAMQQQLLLQQQQQQQRNDLRVNPSLVQKVASVIAPQKVTPAQTEMPKPVQAIQPAYIESLETQLAKDMHDKNKIGGMSARMSMELADDALTLEAKKIKTEQAAAPKQDVDQTPKSVQEVINSVNTMSAPNITNSDSPDGNNASDNNKQS